MKLTLTKKEVESYNRVFEALGMTKIYDAVMDIPMPWGSYNITGEDSNFLEMNVNEEFSTFVIDSFNDTFSSDFEVMKAMFTLYKHLHKSISSKIEGWYSSINERFTKNI